MHPPYAQHGLVTTILAGLLMGIVTSCSAPPAPAAGRSNPKIGKTYPQISVHDRLESTLEFGPPIVDRPPNRPVRVEVPILACDSGSVAVQYRFEFFDLADKPLGPESRWRYINLRGNDQEFVSAVSLDRHIADWRLIVRSARR